MDSKEEKDKEGVSQPQEEEKGSDLAEKIDSEKTPPLVHEIHSINFNLIFIAAVIIGGLMHYLGTLLKPLSIAVFIYYLISPAAHCLFRYKIPKWMTYIGILVVSVILLIAMGFVVYKNVEHFKDRLPEYRQRTLNLIDNVAQKTGYANEQGRFDWENYYSPSELIDTSPSNLVSYVFGTLYDFLSSLLVVLFYLIFIILEAHKLPSRVKRAFPKDQSKRFLRIGQNINKSIRKYLVVKTLISMGTGVMAATILWAFDQDHWVLWGLLTFLFNYIPYIGSLVVSLFPISLAFLTASNPWIGVAVAICLLGNQAFWGNFLEPQVSGRHLDISPLVLLIMLAYWGWLWGVIGLILSIPFAVAIKIILANFERTRPIATLISNE